MADMYMNAGPQSLLPFLDPQAMAQNQADMARFQQNQGLINAVMGQQYVPNSGRAGVFGNVLSHIMGALAQSKQNDKLSDILAQQFQISNAAAQAQRQQQLQDESRKLQEEIYKAQMSEKAKRDYAPLQFQGGGSFDPASGQWQAAPGFAEQEIATKKQEALNAAAASAAYREAPGAGEIAGLNAKIAMAQKMGATPEQIRAMVTGTAGQNPETQVVGNMLVDKRTGKAVPIIDPTTGKAIDASANAKSNAVVEKAQGGLAKQVLNYVSTATKVPVEQLQTMAPEDVEKLYREKGGRDWGTAIASFLPFGQTMAAKANPNLNSFATAAQAMEARIQHPVGTIPYNAEVLARQSSIGPEKTDEFNARFIRSALEDAAGQGSGAAQPMLQPNASGKVPTATATGPNGQKIGLIDGQWVPL